MICIFSNNDIRYTDHMKFLLLYLPLFKLSSQKTILKQKNTGGVLAPYPLQPPSYTCVFPCPESHHDSSIVKPISSPLYQTSRHPTLLIRWRLTQRTIRTASDFVTQQLIQRRHKTLHSVRNYTSLHVVSEKPGQYRSASKTQVVIG